MILTDSKRTKTTSIFGITTPIARMNLPNSELSIVALEDASQDILLVLDNSCRTIWKNSIREPTVQHVLKEDLFLLANRSFIM